MKTLLPLTLTLALLSGASAQTVLDLPGAVARALASGPDVTTARVNLQKAQADVKAKQADPTALVADLTSAQQGLATAQLGLSSTRLTVLQTVVTQYTGLFETQLKVGLNSAQAALDGRNLKVAQAKLAARNGTTLDVSKAQNTLAQDQQELANARAQLPVQEAQLVKTLGLPTGTTISIKAPPAPPRLNLTLASLQSGVEGRLPDVLRASQALETARLQVKLSDNDYTPRRTLDDAKVSADNAQRDLDSARKTAQTNLRDAYRAVQDAVERVRLAGQSLTNQRTTAGQTEARFRSGTAAALEVQTAQVNVQNTQLTLTVAQDTLWKALAALGLASGQDLTGLASGALAAGGAK